MEVEEEAVEERGLGGIDLRPLGEWGWGPCMGPEPSQPTQCGNPPVGTAPMPPFLRRPTLRMSPYLGHLTAFCGTTCGTRVRGGGGAYSVAQSLHALGSDTPLSETLLRAKAVAVYREMCGFVVEESTLLVHRDLEKETWGARPQGGLPEHFARLAEHVRGNVVLLRTNTCNIVTSPFGMDTPLTSATIWVLGREAPVCVHGCGDMEEHCQKATVVVIAEA